MKFLNLLKKFQKGSSNLLLLLVGLGFIVFNLLPIVFPGSWQSDSSPLVTGIFFAIGAVMIFFGVRGLKNVTGTTLEQANYFDKVDRNAADPRLIDEIKNNDQPVEEYYFHYCGKLNQSYIMETPDREPIYEITCDKMGVLNDYIYTFKNHLTGKEFTSNVTHTVTTSYGTDNFSLVDKSYFKIDDVNIWDYIANMGYSLEPYLDPVVFSFKVRHYGIEVADIKAAGTNILPEYEGKGGLRDMALGGGMYKIHCREDDIEAAAIIAFAATRVQII